MRASWITVVSGVPRSGTSLVMQMLAAGGMPVLQDAMRPADADNPRGYFEFAPARGLRRDASWLSRAEGRAVKLVHALLRDLPPERRYRVILVRREPRQIVASQRAMLERRGEALGDVPDTRLAEIFRAELDAVEQWAVRRSDVALLPLDYAGLLADPLPLCQRIDRFLGGGLDVAAMAAAVAPELQRQR